MTGTVAQNTKILPGANYYDLRIEIQDNNFDAFPGQFVHISCGPGFTLRRPLSICEAEGNMLRVCYEVRGRGTEYLSKLAPGDKIDTLPPAGRGFKIREGGRALLVGGGIGIYPLLWCAKLYGSRADAMLGFRSKSLVHLDDEFARCCATVGVITDDRGFVTQLAEESVCRAAEQGKLYSVIHACGPKPMLQGIAELAERFGIDCEVSLEERMACGVGACMGCVCKTRDTGDFAYKRVCADGPVFDAREVIWQ
ncbi:MAG: dihydroorotate dehydrogenase electron transfer subunit [Eubacteriales bacterium]|jgi:dihydroorotate dehydrogenase electron transfer subunit|nr:dihydroorotate dehydrogenase electron transfer subunit [Clostridiales bacterium]